MNMYHFHVGFWWFGMFLLGNYADNAASPIWWRNILSSKSSQGMKCSKVLKSREGRFWLRLKLIYVALAQVASFGNGFPPTR